MSRIINSTATSLDGFDLGVTLLRYQPMNSNA
jgi:hypothetical protein